MKDRVLSIIGALLLFVCFCDHTFSFSIAGVNVRWSQLAACAAAATAFVTMLTGRKVAIGRLHLLGLIFAWGPFSLLYLVSALAGGNAFSTVIKLGWALSSIVGAFAIVAGGLRVRQVFLNALLGAVLLQSCVLVIDSLAICSLEPSRTLIGSAQLSYYENNGVRLLRPAAFYLEPSYFASMMALALIFVLAVHRRTRSPLSLVTFVVGMTSLVLSTSRLGIVSFALLLLASWAPLDWRRWSEGLNGRLIPGLTSTALLVLILASPFGKPLRFFIVETNGFKKIASVAENIGPDGTFTQEHKDRYMTESEVSRYHAIEESFASWKTSMWIGHGVLKDVSNRYQAPPNPNTFDAPTRAQKVSRFPSPSMTTWFELLEESGILGIAAYVLGLILTFQVFWRHPLQIESLLWGATLLGLNYLLTPVFPRFDYWFLSYALMAALSLLPFETKSRGSV